MYTTIKSIIDIPNLKALKYSFVVCMFRFQKSKFKKLYNNKNYDYKKYQKFEQKKFFRRFLSEN